MPYYPPNTGGGGGAVDSVNGQIGDVVLVPSDIDPDIVLSVNGMPGPDVILDFVTSVNGQTGNVVLAPSDIDPNIVLSVNGFNGPDVILAPSDVGSPTIEQFVDLSDLVNTKITSPSLFFLVPTPEYPTVQSAVSAAELLPQADPGGGGGDADQSGIVVLVAGGFYDEAVTISKNVNLVGMGGWSTQINQLAVRPFDDTICPQNVTIRGLFINQVFLTNETAGGGVFNPNMGTWDILFDGCSILGFFIFENLNNISFTNGQCFESFTATNCASLTFRNTLYDSESTLTYVTNTDLPNQPSMLSDPNGITFINSNCANIELVTAPSDSTIPSVLTMIDSSITSITSDPYSKIYVQGGSVQSLVSNGAEIFYYQSESPYTVSDPSKWEDPPPISLNEAIDRIAAVVGDSTPIP